MTAELNRLVHRPHVDAIERSDGADPATIWGAAHLSPVRVPEAVTSLIEGMIIAGRLLPGQALPSERKLATLLGVSRNSVREAIESLTAEGLLVRRGRRGVHVPPQYHSPLTAPILDALSAEDRKLVEIFDLRESMEPAIAAKAAERATDEDVDLMRSLVAQLGILRSPTEMAGVDRLFHIAIAEATNNELHVAFVSRTLDLVRAVREQSTEVLAIEHSQPHELNDAHAAILAAIERRDPVGARDAMLRHIRTVSALSPAMKGLRGTIENRRSVANAPLANRSGQAGVR